MRNGLLSSVAAIVLIAGSGIASAQGTSESKSGDSKGGAVEIKGAADSKTGADVKGKADIKSKAGAAVEQKAAPKGNKLQVQTPANEMKDRNRSRKAVDQNSRGNDVKSRASSDARSGTKEDVKAPGARSESKSSTTGQGAAGARSAVNLTPDQRTKITTVIKRSDVRPLRNVNFSIAVGTRVPRSTHFYRLPVGVIEVYPGWRGYDYVLVGDQILVIHPRTREIVAVLDA